MSFSCAPKVMESSITPVGELKPTNSPPLPNAKLVCTSLPDTLFLLEANTMRYDFAGMEKLGKIHLSGVPLESVKK